MKSHFVGEDLWEVVGGDDTNAPQNDQVHCDVFKKWRISNPKAESILKWSISHGLFDYIMGCKLAHDSWTTLDELFKEKDVARLQLLENELANTSQGNLSISQYFLEIKNLRPEISILDPEEPISEAWMKRHIIRG